MVLEIAGHLIEEVGEIGRKVVRQVRETEALKGLAAARRISGSFSSASSWSASIRGPQPRRRRAEMLNERPDQVLALCAARRF
jgi:hypothetical protein